MIHWISKPTGNCPIQAEGYFLKNYFYFRARYNRVTIEFSKTEIYTYMDVIEKSYTLLKTPLPYDAGWLPKWKCRLLIYRGCFKFLIYKIQGYYGRA